MSIESFKKLVAELHRQGISVVPAQWFHSKEQCFRGPNGLWFAKVRNTRTKEEVKQMLCGA